ncbi:MAG: amino acid ABC transporter ATP-binding protein [Oscillospiraceae bacterium]|jgi:polar amino acid transport system ATP-binding protein|nr:amino acid ABC transporter ATP-binding protein [Oscillospiraceae bacterium]
MSILEVENLTKAFGSAKVLSNISFSLEEGESLAILGVSGSGKTTLLRCLNFLERPDSGSIAVRGEVLFGSGEQNNYSERSIREKRLHFGFVFQSFNLFPQYTAIENVTLARRLAARKLPDFARNKKAVLESIVQEGMELLEQIGLDSKRDFYPHQLSGGQQQRVAIARALALKPDILCFDEPTSALDPELTGEVLRVIRGLAEKKTTMLIVTHEMQFARQVADTILFIDEGVVVEYGAPGDVMDNPSSDRMKRFLERYSADMI